MPAVVEEGAHAADVLVSVEAEQAEPGDAREQEGVHASSGERRDITGEQTRCAPRR